MLFCSYDFLLYFFPIVLFGYFLLQHFKKPTCAKIFLIIASLYFYAFFKWYYLPIILSSIFVNYFLVHLFNRVSHLARQTLFVIAILFNLGILGYFKYYDFFIFNINQFIGSDFLLLNILLPLGISFYTFQQISYVVDNYYKLDTTYGLVDYSLFVTFFPQLIAGPIVLPKEMLPQFEEKEKWKFNYQNATEGLFLFTIGLGKKCIIADTLALLANAGFNTNQILHYPEAWLTSLAFTFQLYFDFSGYCDMAMGIAKFFNIDLPLNFNSPYKSTDFQSFWRKWHMTLGRFMMNYLYIPLGGNKQGKVRTFCNLLIVFIASGFWHGAAWTFLVWGLLHGLGILIHRIWKQYAYGKICGLNGLATIPSIIITFFFVNIFWVFFRAESLPKAYNIICSMFIGKPSVREDFKMIVGDDIFKYKYVLNFLIVAAVIAFLLPNAVTLWKYTKIGLSLYPKTVSTVLIIFVAVLFFFAFIFVGREAPFLYFNF